MDIPDAKDFAAGADIDALGFVFLRSVVSSVLTYVQYEDIGQQAQSVSLEQSPQQSGSCVECIKI